MKLPKKLPNAWFSLDYTEITGRRTWNYLRETKEIRIKLPEWLTQILKLHLESAYRQGEEAKANEIKNALGVYRMPTTLQK